MDRHDDRWPIDDGLVGRRTAAGTKHAGPDEGVPNTKLRMCSVDAAGALWVLGSGSLARWDGQRFIAAPFERPVPVDGDEIGMAHDASGAVWLAYDGGLVRLTPNSDGPMRVEFVVKDPCRSVTARGGSVWAGCTTGLVRVRDGEARRYDARDGLLTAQRLDHVYEDAEGSLWVASRAGLLRLRPRVVETYTERDDGTRFGGPTACWRRVTAICGSAGRRVCRGDMADDGRRTTPDMDFRTKASARWPKTATALYGSARCRARRVSSRAG